MPWLMPLPKGEYESYDSLEELAFVFNVSIPKMTKAIRKAMNWKSGQTVRVYYKPVRTIVKDVMKPVFCIHIDDAYEIAARENWPIAPWLARQTKLYRQRGSES